VLLSGTLLPGEGTVGFRWKEAAAYFSRYMRKAGGARFLTACWVIAGFGGVPCY